MCLLNIDKIMIEVEFNVKNTNLMLQTIFLSFINVLFLSSILGLTGCNNSNNGEASAQPEEVSVTRDPTDIPPPVGDGQQEPIQVDLEAIEIEASLASGSTYTYWTFNGKVPGPFIRIGVGDTVELRLRNNPGNTQIHSIDLHAVTGPGGGAVATQTLPGEENVFTFKALKPGLFVYHCATSIVAHHIANGMYGLILVEPEGGLVPVDKEFYVMQGEIYTEEPFGQNGQLTSSISKLLAQNPTYFVLNGSMDGLTEVYPLHAEVGETVRIFFGVGGPNFISSFHVIGEIFDNVYPQGSISSIPMNDVQTIQVPPGSSTIVELSLEVPGTYLLVDHALSRLELGLLGYLIVEGPENPEIFSE